MATFRRWLHRARGVFGRPHAGDNVRGFPAVDALVQDCKYGLRTFKNNPGFAVVVVVTLALGVGVNTLIFAVVNAVAFRPLPIDHPERVVFVQPDTPNAGLISHSFPNYRDLRDRNVTFDGLLGYRMAPMDVDVKGAPRRTWGYLATGNYFDVLGVQPAPGRFFRQADDQKPRDAALAVLDYDFWATELNADRSVVGTTIRINRIPYIATPADVLRVVLGRIAAFVAAGAVAGIALALAIGPLLMQIVYQASPREPAVLAAVGAVISLVGLVACWAPARRSLRVAPMAALREE